MSMPDTLKRPFKASLVLRSALLVLLISGVVGFVLLTAITRYIAPIVEKNINTRLDGLVSTVENTARIASFLGDASLANEVAKGLLMNPDVAHVIIANEQAILANTGRHDKAMS